jgi:hypothetical protein
MTRRFNQSTRDRLNIQRANDGQVAFGMARRVKDRAGNLGQTVSAFKWTAYVT